MKVRRCMNTLSFLLALSQFQVWFVRTEFVSFQRLSALDGHTCPVEYADTKINVFNRTKCLLHCARNLTCRGVFFEPETLRCVKCAAQFLQLNNISSTCSEFYKIKDMVFAYKVVEKKMQWEKAKQNCLNLGGQLSSVKSAEENTFLANIVNWTLERGIWIGGNGTAGDKFSFEWLDGTSVSSGFVNWNAVYDTAGSNCMKMSKNAETKWKNVDCTDICSSVCKFE